ncbi:unnamed protein product [Amoebophrya sp. A120]|nr:unnamed protein product [Amoebophrya sp. A120]|eukprot:GSA120T00003409001.1
MTPQPPPRARPQPGQYVGLRDLQGGLKVVQLNANTSIKFGKHPTVDANLLLKTPFGATLLYQEHTNEQTGSTTHSWQRAARTVLGQLEHNKDEDGSSPAGLDSLAPGGQQQQQAQVPEVAQPDAEQTQRGKNNQNFKQDNSAQSLTQEQILQMKDEGKSGIDMIKEIAGSSATFAEKTVFSQAKYIARKQKKYIHQLTVLEVTPMLLCEYYAQEKPSKIAHLKFEVLSGLLWHANVFGSSFGKTTARPTAEKQPPRVLVYDEVGGMLAGAVHYRMFGPGDLMSSRSSTSTTSSSSILATGTSNASRNGLFRIHQTVGAPNKAGEQLNCPTARVLPFDLVESLLLDDEAPKQSTATGSCAEDCNRSPMEQEVATNKQKLIDDFIALPEEMRSLNLGALEGKVAEYEAELKDKGTTEIVVSEANNATSKTPSNVDVNPKFVERLRRCVLRKNLVEDFFANTKVSTSNAAERQPSTKTGSMDTFVVALNPSGQNGENSVDPMHLWKLAEQVLRGSGILAVYSTQFQPLAELQRKLRETSGKPELRVRWTHVKMHEYFTREWQVLPMRTHPVMDSCLNLVQGFVLCATMLRVDTEAEAHDLESRERAEAFAKANNLGLMQQHSKRRRVRK